MISLVLIILASMCNAVMDTLAHHFSTSVFKNKRPSFWDPSVSWQTAHKIFSWKYDAWHVAKSAMIVCILCACAFYVSLFSPFWDILVFGCAWNLVFNLFYNKILKKK